MTSITFREAPSLALLATEPMRAALEYVSHKIHRKPKRKAGSSKHPVVVFPGLASNGVAVAPLREYCEALGHPALDWGLGFNTGPQGDAFHWLDDLATHTAFMLESHPGRASLIGWSLGGLYAREVAKRLPGRIRQVITIGTPFNGVPEQTNVAWLFKFLNKSSALKDSDLLAQLRTPPYVPCTAIYSRGDVIVNWQGCRYSESNQVHQNVEIAGSHMGMGWNPEVLKVIESRLAT